MTLRDVLAFAHLALICSVGFGVLAAAYSSFVMALTPNDGDFARKLAQGGWLAIFIGVVLLIAVQTLDQLV